MRCHCDTQLCTSSDLLHSSYDRVFTLRYHSIDAFVQQPVSLPRYNTRPTGIRCSPAIASPTRRPTSSPPRMRWLWRGSAYLSCMRLADLGDMSHQLEGSISLVPSSLLLTICTIHLRICHHIKKILRPKTRPTPFVRLDLASRLYILIPRQAGWVQFQGNLSASSRHLTSGQLVWSICATTTIPKTSQSPKTLHQRPTSLAEA
jgi:hypothetical protein